jgi:O-antigen/teichoic acid export membrane protein
LILVSVPSFIQNTLYYSLLGLLIITIIRLIWLIYLVKAEFYQLRIYPRWLVKILKVSMPLIVGAFIAGLVPYIDGILVASNFDDVTFAIFRYGSRELPISLLMANAMSNAMVPVISSATSFKHSMERLKKESIRLMHILFPISIILTLISTPLFRYVFNPVFIESAGIFKIMLLLVISRVLFPQTILLSFRKNNQILTASVIEVLTKIVVSIIFLKWWGLHGIVWGTVIAFFIEKVVLIYFVHKEKGILPSKYIHFRWWAGYTILLLLVYFFSE